MARKPTGNPTGRPRKEIDWMLFEQLCGVQCTQSEIASMLKVCVDTLIEKVETNYGESFSSVYKKYSESGKCSLRRNQFSLSKTNAAMAIWLGKQMLGQRDTIQDLITDEKAMSQFMSLMDAFEKAQVARSIANSSINIDSISECVTGDNLAPEGK